MASRRVDAFSCSWTLDIFMLNSARSGYKDIRGIAPRSLPTVDLSREHHFPPATPAPIMPPSPAPQSASYLDVVQMLSDGHVKEDVEGACRSLSHAMRESLQGFESISRQLHSIDLQRLSTPFKQRWDALNKTYRELLPCYRANAAYILGRLKLFCTAVLPVSTRRSDRSQRSQDPAQVLQSFIGITSEHIKYTQSLLEKSTTLVRDMVLMHIEIAQLACQHFTAGQKEALELATKSSELEAQVTYLCSLNMTTDMSDPSYMLFSISRLAREFGSKPSRSRISSQNLVLSQNLQRISTAVETLDAQRNEFAYMQYSAQVKAPPNHYLARAQTSMSVLIGSILRSFEASFVLFFSTWARLRTDCRSLAQWMSNPDSEPQLVSCYQRSGRTLYAPLGGFYEIFANGLSLDTPTDA